uniref:Uncharacterized protein n=1 Tax=Glossina pallidipes TaxID=7398 RepID=A0A1A9ZB98_GLOPL
MTVATVVDYCYGCLRYFRYRKYYQSYYRCFVMTVSFWSGSGNDGGAGANDDDGDVVCVVSAETRPLQLWNFAAAGSAAVAKEMLLVRALVMLKPSPYSSATCEAVSALSFGWGSSAAQGRKQTQENLYSQALTKKLQKQKSTFTNNLKFQILNTQGHQLKIITKTYKINNKRPYKVDQEFSYDLLGFPLQNVADPRFFHREMTFRFILRFYETINECRSPGRIGVFFEEMAPAIPVVTYALDLPGRGLICSDSLSAIRPIRTKLTLRLLGLPPILGFLSSPGY